MENLTYAHPDRSHWLGSTDIVKLCRLSHWGNEITVWEEKVAGLNGKAPQKQQEPDEGAVLLELGKYVEPFIAERYEALHQGRVVSFRTSSLAHPNTLYWACSPDFLIAPCLALTMQSTEPYDRRQHIIHGLETKMVLFSGHRAEELETWGEEGTDQVPQDYLIQCQWCLAVTGLPRWDLAALWYGSEIRRYTILPQPELIERLKAIADDFWKNHVLTEKPPLPDGSKEYSRYLAKDIDRRAYSLRYDLDNDPAYQDTQRFAEDWSLVLGLGAATAEVKEALQRKEAAVQAFALRFGTAAKVRCGATEYAIRAQTKKTTDWKGIVEEAFMSVAPEVMKRHTKEGEPFLVTTIRSSPKGNKE